MSDKIRRRQDFLINLAYVSAIAFVVYLIFRYVLELVMPFLIAFALVTAVQPLIRWLKKTIRTQREVVSFLVMLVIFAAIGVGAFFLILNLAFWLGDQFALLSGYYEKVFQPSMTQMWDNIKDFLLQFTPQWQDQLAGVQNAMMQGVQGALAAASRKGVSLVSGFTGGIPKFLIGFIFTIMLSFFISMQYDSVVAFIKAQLPAKARETLGEIRHIMSVTVLRYLGAYLKLMSVTFLELSIGLMVLRTAGAIPIALGIAIFDVLPVFGTGGIVIPWAIMELFKGNFPYAFGLIVLYAIITVVRNIIEPKIVGDQLGLNPIVSLVSIYLGFRLFGVGGMIAMPITTQILLELHRRGKLRLLRPVEKKPAGQGSTEDTH